MTSERAAMKVLAVYQRENTSISVIYKRLIGELSRYADVDVLTDYEDDCGYGSDKINNVYIRPVSARYRGLDRRSLQWLAIQPMSERWSRKVAPTLPNDYDVVLSFVCNSQLLPAIFGQYFSQQTGCKFAIYTVDAIPAPGGWNRKWNEYSHKLKVVKRYFSAADYVAASNKHMLAFQLTTFKHKTGLRSNVLLTPSPDTTYNYPISSEDIFLYTGNLYGLRNPDYVLTAFKHLLKVYPQAQFIFIGMKMKLKRIDKILTPQEKEHIHILNQTDDLAPLFSRAKVLVDIDADLEKDPFLSSKIVTYLKVNRMIVCETGHDTPSREMFAGLNTIIQCDHNADSLYNGMKHALEMASKQQDYSERKELIKEFSTEHVGAILWSDMQQLCDID